MKTILKIASTALALTLMLTGCGGGSSDSNTTTTGSGIPTGASLGYRDYVALNEATPYDPTGKYFLRVTTALNKEYNAQNVAELEEEYGELNVHFPENSIFYFDAGALYFVSKTDGIWSVGSLMAPWHLEHNDMTQTDMIRYDAQACTLDGESCIMVYDEYKDRPDYETIRATAADLFYNGEALYLNFVPLTIITNKELGIEEQTDSSSLINPITFVPIEEKDVPSEFLQFIQQLHQ